MTIARLLSAPVLILTLILPAAALEFNTAMVGGRPVGDALGPQLGADIDWEKDLPDAWYINQAGQVSFNQELSANVADTEDRTLYRWTAGDKELLVREGGQAAGFPAGIVIRAMPARHDIADDGSVMIDLYLQGSGVSSANDEGYVHFTPDGSASVPIREGDHVPGLSPFTTYGFPSTGHRGLPNLWSDGQILAYTKFSGLGVNSSNDEALSFGGPSSAQIFFREGDAAADAGAGSTYRDVFLNNYAASGVNVAISTRILRPDTSVTPAFYLANVNSGNFSLIATDKTPNGSGGTFDSFYAFVNIQVNRSGKAIFSQETALGTNGLYATDAGTITPIAVSGDAAPGTSASFNSATMPSSLLTEAGDIVFYHSLTGADVNSSNDRGVWINDLGGTRLALREGDAAGEFDDVNVGTIEAFAFNEQQRLVVLTELTGSVTPNNNQALWLINPSGTLELIARKGQSFDVDDSAHIDARVIQSISLNGHGLSGADRGRINVLNNSDQLAFGLTFVDGHSGIFVADLTRPSLPGDYNSDMMVDAADYTIWRDTLGSTTDLRANGDDTGESTSRIDELDYAVWKTNFGSSIGGGGISSSSHSKVPEPESTKLLLLSVATVTVFRRITTFRNQKPE